MGPQGIRRYVDIGGLCFLVEADDADRSAAVTAYLHGLQSADEPAVATIRYRRDPPPLPNRPPDQTYVDMRIWRDDDALYLEYATGASARVMDRAAHIGGGTGHLGPTFAYLFYPVVTHLLAGHDRFVLHGAAMARGSDGLLVLGRTGMGKSTLSLAAVQQGWALLGDDLAVVRLDPKGVEVAGIARRTALPGDLGSSALTDANPLPGDHRSRWELPVHRMARGWFPLGAVVRVGHGDRPEGELERWQPLDAFDMVLDSFTSTGNPSHLRRFLPCAAAISRLPAWVLRLGADRATRLADAGALLERMVSGSPAQGGSMAPAAAGRPPGAAPPSDSTGPVRAATTTGPAGATPPGR